MDRIRPTTTDCFSAIRSPELYRNFAIHLFVMFPAAMVMCWLASQLDTKIGWNPFGAFQWRLPVGSIAILTGGVWVWYVYGYLFLAGGGSPGTHVDGGPVRLVDTGPYATIRHPSVLGKLLGVIGLGVIWGSWSFLLFFVPILVIYAVVSNRLIQERFCHMRFGQQYHEYCTHVPMLIPSMQSIRRWKEGSEVLGTLVPVEVAEQPQGIWQEFRWYLLGLFGLITTFAIVALLT